MYSVAYQNSSIQLAYKSIKRNKIFKNKCYHIIKLFNKLTLTSRTHLQTLLR